MKNFLIFILFLVAVALIITQAAVAAAVYLLVCFALMLFHIFGLEDENKNLRVDCQICKFKQQRIDMLEGINRQLRENLPI